MIGAAGDYAPAGFLGQQLEHPFGKDGAAHLDEQPGEGGDQAARIQGMAVLWQKDRPGNAAPQLRH